MICTNGRSEGCAPCSFSRFGSKTADSNCPHSDLSPKNPAMATASLFEAWIFTSSDPVATKLTTSGSEIGTSKPNIADDDAQAMSGGIQLCRRGTNFAAVTGSLHYKPEPGCIPVLTVLSQKFFKAALKLVKDCWRAACSKSFRKSPDSVIGNSLLWAQKPRLRKWKISARTTEIEPGNVVFAMGIQVVSIPTMKSGTAMNSTTSG